MKRLTILAACLLTASCFNLQEALTVKQFTLRDQDTAKQDDPMVQNEKLRRLYGAVSLEERKGRLGQYFTALWNADAGLDKEIVFRYQQGGSGSRIKEMRRKIPAGTSHGKEEFSVIGDNYFRNGRVLSWKMELITNGETIASKQSYLWE
jgi:hypothetical protein